MIANWKLWAGGAVMAAGLSLGAAPPSSAQESSWYCYGAAEIVGSKGLVITQVFEWRGAGPAPQNAMSQQLQPLTDAEPNGGGLALVSCNRDRAKAERFRSDRIEGYRRTGRPFTMIYFSFNR
ncbi:MAG: hypothetical protein ACK4RV_07275 [Caulobacter sp.]